MKCLYPISMKDKHGYAVSVPCGQCIHCRLNHSRQWSIRITHEQLKYGDRSCFLTLTYDDEHLPADRSVHKEHVQLFLKRFRKHLGQNKIRYFGCGEYGDTFGRPHYHIIVFGVPVDADIFRNRHVHYEKGKPCGWHCNLDAWSDPKTHEYYGKVHIGTVTPESANYVASYVVKKVKGPHAKEYYASLGIEPEFVLMSRRPGIGSDYVNSHSGYYRTHNFVAMKGIKYPLPRYYKEKAHTFKVSVVDMASNLLRKGISADRVDDCVKAIVNGFDPLYSLEGAIQAEKNTKARLKIRSSK